MKVRSTAESYHDGDERQPMTMDELRKFVDDTKAVPGDATPRTITRDIGNQRDPYPIIIAMSVTWEEER